MVHLTGAAHTVFAVTQDANGGLHIATHVNTVGLSGVGLTTGNTYHASHADSFVSNSVGAKNEFTFFNNFLMTAPGAGNNVRVHEVVHVTVNANGEITAETDDLTVDCGQRQTLKRRCSISDAPLMRVRESFSEGRAAPFLTIMVRL